MCFFNASGKLNKGKHKRKQRIGKQGKRKDRKQSTIIAEEEIDKAKRNLPDPKQKKGKANESNQRLPKLYKLDQALSKNAFFTRQNEGWQHGWIPEKPSSL